MRKESIIIVIAALLVIAYMSFPKNFVSPDAYFLKEEPADIYMEFSQGGNLNYHSNIPKGIVVIESEEEVREFYTMFRALDFDLWAPHRGSTDYSVYINIGEYRKRKRLIDMSRIDGGYVFFFKDGLYRNDSLAKKIIELLKIDEN